MAIIHILTYAFIKSQTTMQNYIVDDCFTNSTHSFKFAEVTVILPFPDSAIFIMWSFRVTSNAI